MHFVGHDLRSRATGKSAMISGNHHIHPREVTVSQANGRANAALLAETPAQDGRPAAVFRSAGDRFLLVEFGPMELDLTLNFRVLGLNQALKDAAIPGVIETIPALRSILIHYDSTELKPSELIADVNTYYSRLPPVEDLSIPSREITLPMAVNDQWSRADIANYVQFIRKDAPNIRNGNNIDYAAEYNGLRDAEEFVEYVMATPWWNAANGFFPGLPFMFPLDPRDAVFVPKYNPTRTWTAEGAVGVGGPCIAIYPVESAGGYQLFGRTIPIYDIRRRNAAFRDDPILVRPADRIRFERVEEDELLQTFAGVHEDRYRYRIEDAPFSVEAWLEQAADHRDEAAAARAVREQASRATPLP
jgi:allophanate hydrolase subunit 1